MASPLRVQPIAYDEYLNGSAVIDAGKSLKAGLPTLDLPFGPGISETSEPAWQEHKSRRKQHTIVRINKLLRAALIAICGLAVVGYGFDVVSSNEITKLQAQARRLGEQNTELSAQLLHVISFQGIQDTAPSRTGLRVPEQVLIVKEVPPAPFEPYQATKHNLPIMAGY